LGSFRESVKLSGVGLRGGSQEQQEHEEGRNLAASLENNKADPGIIEKDTAGKPEGNENIYDEALDTTLKANSNTTARNPRTVQESAVAVDGQNNANDDNVDSQGLEGNMDDAAKKNTAIPTNEHLSTLAQESAMRDSLQVSESDTESSERNEDEDEGGETATYLENVLNEATVYRQQGKHFHDEGHYENAANCFRVAGNLIHPTLQEFDDLMEEFATCRLHQALCHLKAEEYEAAKLACTHVLDDCSGDASVMAPALRARAFHRRAKAELGLGDSTLALQDARSAAFLGDRKAVALYGRLMRESSPIVGRSPASPDIFTGSAMGDLSTSSSLLESLLSKPSSPSRGSSDPLGDGMFPASLLSGLGTAGPTDGGGLAKSVLSSLSKRLEDENTQETICRFLQNTSGPQLQQFAVMAGVPLQSTQATKIAAFCQGVTPKLIRRTVKSTKRIAYVVQLVRKSLQLLAKYRNVIIILCILAWVKSALLRPVPIDKKAARRAIEAAAKAATTAM
jgi:tetratricopeptide (TPR) repeat protein